MVAAVGGQADQLEHPLGGSARYTIPQLLLSRTGFAAPKRTRGSQGLHFDEQGTVLQSERHLLNGKPYDFSGPIRSQGYPSLGSHWWNGESPRICGQKL